jgi:DNA repair protein SbcD/Mre11
MVKIVHFADLHLDTTFRWAAAPAARRRRQALRDVLNRIVDLAVEAEADVLTCGGDLYEHEMTAPDTADVLRAAFERVHPMPVLLAAGNHDWFGPRSLYAQTDWSPNVHVFSSARLEPFEVIDGITVWGASHLAPANTNGFLDSFRVDRSGTHIALFHGSMRSGLVFQGEGKQPHAPFDSQQISGAGFHHALLGHFHKPTDGASWTYPGNPDPLSFGEDGERGAVVLTVSESGISHERRPVNVTMLSDLRVDLTGCSNSQDVRRRMADHLADVTGTVRVTMHGEVGADVEPERIDFNDIAPHLEQKLLRFEGLTVAYDLEAIAAQIGTVRARFVQDLVEDTSLDDDTRRKVILTGLRAFAGRADLEVH